MPPSFSHKEKIKPFAKLLDKVVIENISGNTYCKRYLAHLLKHKLYYLDIYAVVLDKLQAYSNRKVTDTILIDFGAGNGMLGIFAKYCGFKKVYINDLDPDFLKAAEKFAAQLNVIADGYIYGGVLALQKHFTIEQPTAIVGTDVIEHIYNLDEFFTVLQQINPSITSVFTTASNPHNYLKVRQLHRMQWRDEYKGTIADENATNPTGHASFLSMRKDIINNHFPSIKETAILQLAIATRGLNEPDIIDAVKKFSINHKIPVPADAFNTCNPYTSSWTERIISLEKYKQLYAAYGFELKLYNGFYNDKSPGSKRIINNILNLAVSLFGKTISSFIGLVGFKK